MADMGLHLCRHFVQILCQKSFDKVRSSVAGREDKRVEKYSNLSDNYHFVPLGIETCGNCSPQGIKAVCMMGCPKDIFSGLEGLFNFQVHEAEEL